MGAISIDLLDGEAVIDPHTYLRRVRDADPISWSERHRAWLITGHPEISEAFRDQRLSTEHIADLRARMSPERAAATSAAMTLLNDWMVFHEPPRHTRLRAPLARSFTPKATANLTGRVTAVAEHLLDDLEATRGGDYVDRFSHALPAAVIAELFGVPDDEVEWLAGWSERFGVVVFGATGHPDYLTLARASGEEFGDRLGGLIEHYRAAPENNLLSLLLASEGAEGGLTTPEIIGACSLLLFAGHDTTSSLLGSGLLALLERPDQLAQLRDGTVEVGLAVEELLRFEPPAKAVIRTVIEDHERGGHHLRRGDSVFLTILAANRDPTVFDRPDDLMLDRSPNPHVSFGFGHHFCLGAALARLEARIAFPLVLRRFPDIRLDGPIRWRETILDRSPTSFRVVVWPADPISRR
ncbi:MAG: cytochrome P450 [Ilumatobacter sp.]